MEKYVPFLIVFLLTFYALPFAFVSDILLLAATPIILLLAGIIFGALFGFSILLSILCAICAIPLAILTNGKIFIVYILVFFIATLLGNVLGLLFRKKA